MTRPGEKTSLFSALVGHLDKRTRTREQRRDTVEVGLGFLLFFCLVSLFATAAASLRGETALTEALISALFVTLTWTVFKRWRALGGTLSRHQQRR